MAYKGEYKRFETLIEQIWTPDDEIANKAGA